MSYELKDVSVTDVEGQMDGKAVGSGLRLGAVVRRRCLSYGFPRACVHCNGLISSDEDPSEGLGFFCNQCRMALSPSAGDCCRKCGSPGADEGGSPGCCSCREGSVDPGRGPESRALDGIFWCWPYGPPISSAVTAMKFRRLDFLADDLAVGAVAHLRGRLPDLDGVGFVPLHWARRWGRGYDQASLLASKVATELGARRYNLLRRNRRTSAQSQLNESERRANLRFAFSARRGAFEAVGKSVLLVDDVVTTGSTLEAAARVLKRAGISKVWGFAVARTPQERNDSM